MEAHAIKKKQLEYKCSIIIINIKRTTLQAIFDLNFNQISLNISGKINKMLIHVEIIIKLINLDFFLYEMFVD